MTMNDNQKKECRAKNYMNYTCGMDCEDCKRSYNYVLGYHAGYFNGYSNGYRDGYGAGSPAGIGVPYA